MLALLTDRKSGEVSTYDVPAPELRPGGLLVRTQYSAISAGTERATLELSSKSLLAKARARPDLVKQVIEYARQNGRKKVSAVAKANIMKFTDGLFFHIATEVAKDYPDIE